MTAGSAPGVPATLVGTSTVAGRGRGVRELGRATVAVIVAGVVLTTALTWAAARAHSSNERRLLEEQAEEASAVLQQAVPAIIAKAQEAARVAALLRDDVDALAAELAVDAGERGRFAAITITIDGERLMTVGSAPRLTGDDLRAAAATTDGSTPAHVTAFLQGDEPRVVYSATTPNHTDVVAHAEQALSPDRIDEDREGAAFRGVEVALYLGDGEDRDQLLTATTADLPLDGPRAVRTLPFGDQTMHFVVSPAGNLGGGLLRTLPWLTFVAGLLSSAIGAVLVEILHRRRRDAEAFTREVQALYRREHAIAHTLQHSLLPTHLDRLEGIEVAARYFAGAEGTDIGGDWYDVVTDADRFTVVVGDVVGRGVQAAAVMAAMRYGTHAVAGQRRDPGDVLEAVNALEHIRGDFVTMLCGSVEPATRSVRLASAGHPAPLLIGADEARFLHVESGPPIGFLDGARYGTERTTVPPGSVLLLFTDGLYERRGESIEVGLERLRAAAVAVAGQPIEHIVDGIAAAMLGDVVRDDTAMLAVRIP